MTLESKFTSMRDVRPVINSVNSLQAVPATITDEPDFIDGNVVSHSCGEEGERGADQGKKEENIKVDDEESSDSNEGDVARPADQPEPAVPVSGRSDSPVEATPGKEHAAYCDNCAVCICSSITWDRLSYRKFLRTKKTLLESDGNAWCALIMIFAINVIGRAFMINIKCSRSKIRQMLFEFSIRCVSATYPSKTNLSNLGIIQIFSLTRTM